MIDHIRYIYDMNAFDDLVKSLLEYSSLPSWNNKGKKIIEYTPKEMKAARQIIRALKKSESIFLSDSSVCLQKNKSSRGMSDHHLKILVFKSQYPLDTESEILKIFRSEEFKTPNNTNNSNSHSFYYHNPIHRDSLNELVAEDEGIKVDHTTPDPIIKEFNNLIKNVIRDERVRINFFKACNKL